MATPGNSTPGGKNPGKKDRREAAREKARLDREAERKRVRRNRLFLQGGVGIAVIAIAAIVMLVIVNQPKPVELSTNAGGPLNMASDGILLSGPDLAAVPTPAIAAGGKPTPTKQDRSKLNIVTYIDYQCPFCQQFETTNNAQLKELVSSGAATLEIHPIANLDRSSQRTMYSTRAANAAACVANYDPDNFFAVNAALFANQPPENTPGLSDDELISILSKAGPSSNKISACVKTQEFSTWVGQETQRTRGTTIPNSNLTTPPNGLATPTVIVNGVVWKPKGNDLTDTTAFTRFLATVPTE
ncbi:DsbA family protein [Parafrigoribacterium humi]|uniref:DsbA family protein n=1 Tax=Parafrigoribacterium humi TaxID=3144664 RepID=UPI0032EE9DC1